MTGAPADLRATITAVVPTRDRGHLAVATVETLLANRHDDFKVLVIDQSADDETKVALGRFANDPRFRYERTNTVGKGRSQNLALELVDSDYVAFTDDDCEVPPDWLSCITAILDREPKVAVLYTNVVGGPHDASAGFIPDYVRKRDTLVTSLLGKVRARGIGAGMAVRADAAMMIGGFDEHMGPGGSFPSAADRDIAIRALLGGWHVYETSQTAVVHHGFRTWDQGRDLTRRDWEALGAMCAKPLRQGHWITVAYPIYELGWNGFLQPLARIATLKRPQGFKRAMHFGRGFRRAWRTPIDPARLVFAPADPADRQQPFIRR